MYTRAVHNYIVMRPNEHNCGRGYNLRSMPSIWCPSQAPSCQFHIYTVLKAALRKDQVWVYNNIAIIECRFKLGRKIILIDGASLAGYRTDSHIFFIGPV